MESIDRYILENISPEEELLRELDRQTHLRTPAPQMISGHLQGRFLEMIARLTEARTVLEIGTFTGYAAICLARGLDEGGVVHTIEGCDEVAALAEGYFRRAEKRMPARIVQHIGDALTIGPQLGLTFDLVFIDAEKREYPAYYNLLMDTPLVHPGSCILADNILWYGKVADNHATDASTEAIRTFNRLVADDPRVENVILPLRDGLNLIRVK